MGDRLDDLLVLWLKAEGWLCSCLMSWKTRPQTSGEQADRLVVGGMWASGCVVWEAGKQMRQTRLRNVAEGPSCEICLNLCVALNEIRTKVTLSWMTAGDFKHLPVVLVPSCPIVIMEKQQDRFPTWRTRWLPFERIECQYIVLYLEVEFWNVWNFR